MSRPRATTDFGVVTLAHDLATLDSIEDWRDLYDRHFDAVLRLILRFGIEPAEAEDLAQVVFIRAHKKLIDGAELRHPSAWLRGIAVRVVAEHRRWARLRRLKRWLVRSTSEAQSAPPPTPEQHAQGAETTARVRRVLERLSPKRASALVLLDIEELSLDEAAEILGVPVNTVRSRRRLAREAFRRLWEGP